MLIKLDRPAAARFMSADNLALKSFWNAKASISHLILHQPTETDLISTKLMKFRDFDTTMFEKNFDTTRLTTPPRACILCTKRTSCYDKQTVEPT